MMQRALAACGGLVLLVTAVVPGTAGSAAPSPVPCTVAPQPAQPSAFESSQLNSATESPQNADELSEFDAKAWRAKRLAVQEAVAVATGAGHLKERIAEQLRRGIIGTVADDASQTITVVTTADAGLPAALEGELAATAGAQVIAGCFTAADLIAADDVLFGRAWHPDAGRAAFSYALHATDSRFHVRFDGRYPEAARALQAALGERVTVSLGTAARAGRTNDGRPHFGGAGIRNGKGSSSTNTCTSGFVVRRNQWDRQYGAISAGHCFHNDRYLYSGPYYYGYSWGKYNFPTYDIIGIRSGSETYDNVIHVDPCCPSKRYVTGYHRAAVGDRVCLSGMVTRAVCSVRVTSINGYFCDDYGCTGGLIEGIRYNDVIVRGGDSGGPIYTQAGSSGARAVGMIVASAGSGTIVYGEHIGSVESYLNVTLLTS